MLLHGTVAVGPAGVEPASNRVSDGCLAARPRPERSALYGTRTRLACSTGRSPHPLRHRAFAECPAGVAPACPAWEAGAWLLGHGHDKQGRKESNPLRAGWS